MLNLEGKSFADESLTEKDMEEIYDAIAHFVEKKFGKNRADLANYDWVTTDEGVCSKIYGMGEGSTFYIDTTIEDGKLKHIVCYQ